MTCPACEQSSNGPRNRLDRNTRAGRILSAPARGNKDEYSNTRSRDLKKQEDRKMKRTKRTEVMIGVAVMLALMLAGKLAVEVKTEAAAVTTMGNILTVTSPLDDGSQGTLRQAIADAMAGDTIDFALNYPATITLTSGELGIGKNLTIKGPGGQSLKVSGNHVIQAIQSGPGTTGNLPGLTTAD